MKFKSFDSIYESPNIEILEINVEQGFAASSNPLENLLEGEESGW